MKKLSFTYYWDKIGTLMILIVMMLVISIFASKNFLSGSNLIQIVTQSATIILIACGEFFAILIAGIDLSVGSVVALTGLLTAQMMTAGVSPLWAGVGCIFIGALLGLINGSLVNLTKVHPFIITLGTLAIFRGLTMIISNGRPVFGFPDVFKTAFGVTKSGIPMAVIIALSVAAILWFITSKTTFGKNLYAIGGNKDAAWYAGINVRFHTLLVFVISGACAGICGAVMIARLGAAEPLAGSGSETSAIAAAIIGGTSFFGGKGNILNVVIGGVIIGLINNGLNMMGVETYYQQVAMGSLIIIAVTLDNLLSSKR
jgi:D-allose transport system permease protein